MVAQPGSGQLRLHLAWGLPAMAPSPAWPGRGGGRAWRGEGRPVGSGMGCVTGDVWWWRRARVGYGVRWRRRRGWRWQRDRAGRADSRTADKRGVGR
jgi:hypothetical protein